MSNLRKNFSYLFLGQLFNQFLPLAIVPYLTRKLSLELYGVYAYMVLCIGFISVIIDYGFNIYGVKKIVSARDSIKRMKVIFSGVFSAKILILSVSIAFYYLLIILNGSFKNFFPLMFWGWIAILGIALQNFWFFSGLEKNHIFVISVLVSKIIFLILVFCFVNDDKDFFALILFYGVSQVLVFFISHFFIIKKIGGCFFSWRIGVFYLKKSYPFFLSRLAVTLYTTGAGVYLGFFSSANNVALYSVADQIYRGIQSLISPISQVMYPYMLKTKNFIFLYKLSIFLVVLMMFNGVAGYYFSPFFLGILFGRDYVGASSILNVFFVVLVIVTPSILLGYPLFGAKGILMLTNKTVIYAGFFQLFLFLFLWIFNKISPFNVAMTVLFTELLVLLLRVSWGIFNFKLGFK